MSDKIKIEDILHSHGIYEGQRKQLFSAIKELIELAIDKCQEYQKDSIYPQNLQPVKKIFDYD